MSPGKTCRPLAGLWVLVWLMVVIVGGLAEAAEVILDNGQAGTTSTGTWSTSTAPNPYGANSLYSNGSGLDTYRWTPTIPTTGDYQVYVWWTQHSNRSATVPYTVVHANGTSTFTKDQRSGGGQWQYFGTFTFNAGTAGYIEVSDANGQAAADAVRWVTPRTLTVSKAGTGSGTVTSSPAGIDCGADCSEIYAEGTAVTLTAASAQGSTFAGWSGDADCADGAVTLSANRACTATFMPATTELIIDNGQAGSSSTGTWSTSSAPNPYGANSLYSNGSGLDTYRWTPTIPTTGDYQVYVWWTASTTRSTTVPYTLVHAGGSYTTTKNHRVGGGQWQLLGTFTFNAGTGGYLEVTDANGQAGADATRWVKLGGAPSGTLTYHHDQLGRLVAVVDPGGDTAIYTYDAVGNLLQILRQGSGQVAIIVAPLTGEAGSTITLYGTGFSLVPGQNTVTFNGVAGTVISATATELVVTVPATATTGPIVVTTPAGTATSSTSFTAASTRPSITGITPSVGTAGTAVTIAGANFEPIPTNNRLSIHRTRTPITTASATTLVATIAAGTTSGRVSLATPGGTAPTSLDFFVPPGPHAGAAVEFTGRLAIDGSSLTATIGTAEKIALVLFDGTAGQPLSLGISGVTLSAFSEADVTLYQPEGPNLAYVYVSLGGGEVHLPSLPTTGTYTILIDPRSTSTGNLTLTLSEGDVNGGTIAIGGPSVSVSMTRPGQRGRLSFGGTAGQRLSLAMPASTVPSSVVLAISNPDGTTLMSGSGWALDLPPLPATGTYTILIDPSYANTGTVTLLLSEEIDAGAIGVGGASVSVSIARLGQRARLTFSGAAGQRLSLGRTGVTIALTALSVYKPDATTLVGPTSVGSADGATDLPVLPVSGTYSILIDPVNEYTGNMTLTLSEEVAGPIAPNGPPVAVSIARAGQRARLTFSGAAGQRVMLRMSGISLTQSAVSILKPDDTTLIWAPTVSANETRYLDPTTLPVAGTYTILVDPAFAYTGNMTLTLYDVPPDVTGTLVINDPAVAVALASPGQKALLTFAGTAGQPITIRGTGNTIGCLGVGLAHPSGGTGWGWGGQCGSTFTLGLTLTQTGTHTLTLDPDAINTGSLNIQVTNP